MTQYPLLNLIVVCAIMYGLFLLHFYISVSLGKAHSTRYQALAFHFRVASLLSGLALALQIVKGLYTLENALAAAVTTVLHLLVCIGGHIGQRKLLIAAGKRELAERESMVEELTENYKVSGVYARYCELSGNSLNITNPVNSSDQGKLPGV